MKARIENDTIVLYPVLPSQYKSEALGLVLAGFDTLDDATHKAEGFFNVIEPALNPGQMYGSVIFNATEGFFIYTIIEKPAPAPNSILSKLQFFSLFTGAEKAAIFTVARQSIEAEIWLETFRISQYIDLKNQQTIVGVTQLEAAGILTQGRAAEILTC